MKEQCKFTSEKEAKWTTGLDVELNKEIFDPNKLWEVVQEAWDDSVRIKNVNTAQIGKHLELFFTLCPLYKPSDLKASEILHNPSSIEESRVSNKWTALHNITGAMAEYLSSVGGSVHLNVVFANKGVLLGHDPTPEDEAAIEIHDNIYREAISSLCLTIGASGEYRTYDDFKNIHFPRFVKPYQKIPNIEELPTELETREDTIIWLINKYMNQLSGPEFKKIESNKRNRKLIGKIANAWNPPAAFWIVSGYLAFDHLIPRITRENSIYMVTERFDPLFGIASFTKELKDKPRIDIKA